MNALLSHLDFNNFKENKSVNKSEEVMPGIRPGVVFGIPAKSLQELHIMNFFA